MFQYENTRVLHIETKCAIIQKNHRKGGAVMKTKFPEYLAMFRSQRGYTQARIAEKLKISRSTYANYESGNRSPDLEMLERIGDVLNCSLDELFGRSGSGIS